jgi:hypothetical protein
MDRYSATRLVLRICVLALSIGPARGQVQVGELMVTPEADGVTVTLAQSEPQQEPLQQEPSQQQPQQQEYPFQPEDGAPVPVRHGPHVTRISLSPDDLPPAQAEPYSARPLPPMPAPRSHEMERDVLTLKAAHAAMLLDDQLHQHSKRTDKLAALR